MSAMGLTDIDACWPFVLSRAGRAGLDPGDLAAIRGRCLMRRALCLAAADGVVIVSPKLVRGTMTLWVLLAVSAGEPGAFSRHQQELADMARQMGAERLVFHTKRRGWARMLGPGWRFDGEYYTRGV